MNKISLRSYRSTMGVLILVFSVFGITFTLHTMTADTTSSFTGAVPYVTFTVTPFSTVDCSYPIHPTTNVSFVADPTQGGSFSLSSDSSQSIKVESGIKSLSNGTYVWHAIINSYYTGSGKLEGGFILRAECPLVVDTASSTLSTTTTATTTIDSATTTIVSSGSSTTTDGTTESTIVTSTITDTTLEPVPETNVSFSVIPTTITNCLDHVHPTTNVLFTVHPSTGGMFNISTSTVAYSTVVNGGTLPLSNGDYEWHAVVNQYYKGVSPLLGKFTIKTLCPNPVPSPVAFVLPMPPTREISTSSHGIIPPSSPPKDRHVPAVQPTPPNNTSSEIPSLLPKQTPIREILDSTSKEEKHQILTYGKDSTTCASTKECAVFCEQENATSPYCAGFVRTEVQSALSARPSIADGISEEQIEDMLTDFTRRPPELPAIVTSPTDFRSFCADAKRSEECSTIITSRNLAPPSVVASNREQLVAVRMEEKKIFAERVGSRIFIDSDTDGISDYDEVNIYHTDPEKADTNSDGTSDGDEILAQKNPLEKRDTTSSSAPRQEITVPRENPLIAGNTETELLKVHDVGMVTIATSTQGISHVALTIKGTALPNSFITLYVFSDPIVVTIKTDEFGEWTYTLDKELPDGNHQIISAITDSGGRVLAASEPLSFVKIAEAVTIGTVELALPVTEQEPGFFSGMSLYAFITIIIGIVGFGFLIMGIVARSRPEGDSTTFS